MLQLAGNLSSNVLLLLVQWVRTCLITPKFSVAINGSLASYFERNKGLRQEDLLPLYLFVLAM